MSKKVVIAIIVILLLINLLAVGFFYLSRKVHDTSGSFIDSISNSKVQNFIKFGFSAQKLPEKDVDGEDLAEIGRYPSSVRINYKKTKEGAVVEYQTKDTTKMVLGYFKTKLAKDDWLLISANQDIIIYLKNDKKITISAQTDQASLLTNYKISL